MEYIEVTGRTIDDALTNACLKLETTSDNIEYEVIEKGSNGLFGIFNSKPTKIKARVKAGVGSVDDEFSKLEAKEKKSIDDTIKSEIKAESKKEVVKETEKAVKKETAPKADNSKVSATQAVNASEEDLEEKAYSGKVTIFSQAIFSGKKELYDRENSGTNTIPPRIAVAKDEAFCFYYRDNLRMLEHYGAELVFFSPLHDEKLPENIHGLLLGGGYPELYAKQLAENESMRKSIKEALEQHLPSLAECGGFMYLHETLTDKDGKNFPMVGVIPAECQYTGKLVRFGYVEVQLPQGLTEKGIAEMPEPEKIKAHEFHYFDSTANGEDCIATKPVTGRSWKCIHASDDHFWGFPHLYYPSNPKFVKWFLERTEKHI